MRLHAQYCFGMRRLLPVLLLFVSFALYAADTGGVLKVLPFWVDQQGRIAKSPSLFDRDAYQAFLLEHTNDISGIRYDVHWKKGKAGGEDMKLRVELRGVTETSLPKSKILEVPLTPGTSGAWTEVPFTGDEFKQFGSIIAWHTTLWSGTNMVGEQKSFLW